jgi:hypothetical protein
MWKTTIVAKFAKISRRLAGETENDDERTQDSRPLSQDLKAEPPEERYSPDHNSAIVSCCLTNQSTK